VEYNKGNMAWGAVVGASVNLMGAPASHVAAVEQLIKLDMAA
jgi:gas vesicle protein